jgi:hypothetical protein
MCISSTLLLLYVPQARVSSVARVYEKDNTVNRESFDFGTKSVLSRMSRC